MQPLCCRNARSPAIAALRSALALALGAAADAFPGLAEGDAFDADVEAAVRQWQAGSGLVADGIVGPYCQSLLGLRPPGAAENVLNAATVRRFFPATRPASISRYLPYVLAALDAAGLNDRPMLCAALGTIKAESEGFVPIGEYPSHFNTLPGKSAFSAYDGKLGNLNPGDGAAFRGRGFVQLTGRTNYRTYGERLGIDLTGNPDLANAPEVAAVLLAAFLADHAERMRQALADHAYAEARRMEFLAKR